MASQFLSLRDEILLRLWYYLLPDLSAHVAIAQTCRRLRRVYADDNLWRTACFSAGYGRPLVRRAALRQSSAGTAHSIYGTSRDKPSWKSIAHMLVAHPSTCEIRSCTQANVCFAEHYQFLVAAGRSMPFPSDTDAADFIVLHPLYFYLHFTQTSSQATPTATRGIVGYLPTPSPSPSPSPPQTPPPPPAHVPDPLSILLTHLPTYPESRSAQYGPLCTHPNASCAFATFPPVERLAYGNVGTTVLTVENPEGCTILDVNRALAELIGQDDAHFGVALAHYQELAMASGVSLAELADEISRERGFLGDHEYPYIHALLAQA
ncbi:hypothetical protein OBBRIDRAFT_273506 [Obba rivulosa]|uniref:F-box domain-containing protein n=1 Tax=Obba rivulosa TaxID=1052685 RepID=A0A8E2DGF2_9APHY|nr:hypothetical protein OBBRIDRAFT_273506 [Obba rivulosa]